MVSTLSARVACLPTLELLRAYVHKELCARDHLSLDATPLLHSLIVRRGRVCGLFFQVDGPRQLKNYAIWAGDEARILFYDACGERLAETKLSDSPDPATLAPNRDQRLAA